MLEGVSGERADFEYVVERKKPGKICFGSGIPRNINPLQKPFLPNVGPGSYEIKSELFKFLNKLQSRKGVGSLVNGAPRFSDKLKDEIPSSTRYDITTKRIGRKQCLYPFGSGTKRKPVATSITPGPGTYYLDVKLCKKIRFDSNFGRPKMVPTVEEFCIPKPTDSCVKCTQICVGDYWYKNHQIILCQPCMHEEQVLNEVFSKIALRSFKKIRNCQYMHRHEGTTATIQLLQSRIIKKKRWLENYLNMFMKCY